MTLGLKCSQIIQIFYCASGPLSFPFVRSAMLLFLFPRWKSLPIHRAIHDRGFAFSSLKALYVSSSISLVLTLSGLTSLKALAASLSVWSVSRSPHPHPSFLTHSLSAQWGRDRNDSSRLWWRAADTSDGGEWTCRLKTKTRGTNRLDRVAWRDVRLVDLKKEQR